MPFSPLDMLSEIIGRCQNIPVGQFADFPTKAKEKRQSVDHVCRSQSDLGTLVCIEPSKLLAQQLNFN